LWSASVPSDPLSAFSLVFYPGNVYPDSINGRQNGFAVRCLSPGGAAIPTVTLDTEAGAVPATVKSFTNTQIVIETPAHSAGLVSITVDNGLDIVTLPATWLDTGTSTSTNNNVANIKSGYLYIEPYINLTLNPNSVTISDDNGTTDTDGKITPTANGTFAKGSNVLTTQTNNPTGYSLSISTNLPKSDSNPSDLRHVSLANTYLESTPHPCDWDNTTKTMIDTPYALDNNTWGFTLNPTSLNNQQLCQVTAQDEAILIKQTTTANESGDITTIYYGAKVTTTKPSGKYQGTVVYSVVGET
jgi:hypothetical protein